MEAQTLFREGVSALRDRHDVAQAQRLLAQSLKLDPKNDLAWLWLSRTTDDPQRKLQCVERALSINPQNVKAMTLRAKLLVAAQSNPDMDWRARLDAINAPVSFQAPEIHTAPKPKSAAGVARTAAVRTAQTQPAPARTGRSAFGACRKPACPQ